MNRFDDARPGSMQLADVIAWAWTRFIGNATNTLLLALPALAGRAALFGAYAPVLARDSTLYGTRASTLLVSGLLVVAWFAFTVPAYSAVFHYGLALLDPADRPPRRQESWSAVRRSLPALYGVGAAQVLCTLLTLTVFLIPIGVYLVVRFTFGELTVVEQRLPTSRALGESLAATRGHWWRTAVTLLAVALLSAVPSLVLDPIASAAHLATGATVAIDAVLGYLTVPFAALAVVILYDDLRARSRAPAGSATN